VPPLSEFVTTGTASIATLLFEMSKKMLPTASTLIRAVVVAMFGIVNASEPSFAVVAASTCG
jgi:hypothetical protein